jgi:hypothetical protein
MDAQHKCAFDEYLAQELTGLARTFHDEYLGINP